jgi:hypothetical protein
MKKILLIFLLLVFIQGCSSASKLNSEERIVYDLIIEYIGSFKNPESVRVHSANYNNLSPKTWVISIRAENGFGATSTSCYYFSKESFYEVSDSRCSSTSREGISVAKLNEAIKEYISNQGWD